MTPTKITAVHSAGPDHQVLTVEGGSGSYRREPCPECPWRVDQTDGFPAEAFLHSANTAYDMATHIFGCHESGKENPATCAGFLLKGAVHNLSFRMRAAAGKIDMEQVHDGGLELHESYRAMAVANGCDLNDPELLPCR